MTDTPNAPLLLECFPTTTRPPDLVPGRPQRGWMEKFVGRHPYRCLPLTMANSSGWEILCPVGFAATWNGGPAQSDITITPDHPFPGFEDFVKSHFSHGVITFHPGYLFRTPPGWAVWTSGPPNHVKDGIQPLTGLVETDWLPFPFTMNWIFTRPGRVKWEKGEPFCFITLMEHRKLEDVQPIVRSLDRDPEIHGQFEVWNRERSNFNRRLSSGDPDTVRESWQRFYFKGEIPEEGPAPVDHVNKRRLKPIKFSL